MVLLAKQLHLRGVHIAVMVFYGNGPFRAELEQGGVRVIDLQKSGRWDILGFLLRTIAAVRRERPQVIYNFIGSHLVSTVLKLAFANAKVVWGVRASNMDLSQYDRVTRYSEQLSIWLSRFADAIICNSQAGKKYIVDRGYKNTNIVVVGNGIDTERFRFDAHLRSVQRSSWGILDNEILIGVVARLDPMKDHGTFLRAASLCMKSSSALRFVCVGAGDSNYRHDLMRQAAAVGIGERVIWAGHQSNLAAVYSALDVFCSSSVTEGFPNTVAEAMACGLPVVATDVGDCREIVGESGWIVPVLNPSALADGLAQAVAAVPQWQRDNPRTLVIRKFGVNAMVDQTLDALTEVASL